MPLEHTQVLSPCIKKILGVTLIIMFILILGGNFSDDVTFTLVCSFFMLSCLKSLSDAGGMH